MKKLIALLLVAGVVSFSGLGCSTEASKSTGGAKPAASTGAATKPKTGE